MKMLSTHKSLLPYCVIGDGTILTWLATESEALMYCKDCVEPNEYFNLYIFKEVYHSE